MDEASLKPIIENFENMFSKFNERFYDNQLQSPVITVSPDTRRRAYGWCTTWRAWSNDPLRADHEHFPPWEIPPAPEDGFFEINICAEYLARSFEDLAETMLHEMVHLYNIQIGVKDTSRSGTYHNRKYKATAEQHGLVVERDPQYGWTLTSLNDESRSFVRTLPREKYDLYRRRLPKARKNTKESEEPDEPEVEKKPRRLRKYVCPVCNDFIGVSKDMYVICGKCNVAFEDEKSLLTKALNVKEDNYHGKT